MEHIIKIIKLFDKHPWDWLAHFLLGLFVFLVEWALLMIIWDSVSVILAIWGSLNFIVAVELTQIDLFGIKNRWKDTLLDLLAGVFGISIAVLFI